MNSLLLLFFFIQTIKGIYYTNTEISSLCTAGNADSNPPTLSPGNTTISQLASLTRKNFLSYYYNQNDYSLTYDDKVEMAKDLSPYYFFLYLAGISVIFWLMYLSCMICKCCFCISGPAIEVQTRKRLLFPPILMGVFLVGILVFAPFCIYYINLLQGTIAYLVCVTARFSGGYWYGYENWNGIFNINNSTSDILSYLNTTTHTLNSTLHQYNNNPISNASEEIKQLLSTFISNWSNTHPSYSTDLPEYYECQLCSDIVQYNTELADELDTLITPLSQNITTGITLIYTLLINQLNNLTTELTTQYNWTSVLTQLYNSYEQQNLPFFASLNSLKDGMYSNSLSLFAISILVMFSQAFAANMVYFKKYRWRKLLHLGWCCHSLLAVFCKIYLVFTISGLLFITSMLLGEGCTVFTEIIQAKKLGNVFVYNI